MAPKTSGDSLAAVQDVLQAVQFAADRHKNQRRKGDASEPYVNHVIEVATLVAMALPEPDPNLVMAALLHDTIEDTGTTTAELVERFGGDVADLVIEVTDDKSLPKSERKRLQVVNAPKKSVRAQMIKVADKISNLRSIIASPPTQWDYERKRQYFIWAKNVVDGLTQPNATLKEQFDTEHGRFGEITE